jgi:redox-sensing transcriptional repressor
MTSRMDRQARPISESTTTRLSIYLRCLTALDKAGVETISSKELASRFDLNSALIRKDLAYFGEFGVRGVGYRVSDLKSHIIRVLGLDRELRVLVIGAGNLGQALSAYRGFNSEGCRIVALADTDPAKVGTISKGGIPIVHVDEMERVVREDGVNIAILAVPVGFAQPILDRLTRAGVRAVLNFVPERLKAGKDVFLKDVDLKIQIEGLAFHLAQDARAENH